MKLFVSSIVFLGLSFSTMTYANEIKGTTTNTSVKNKDGLVDFSLVIPGLNQEQIINFDLGRVISPDNDQIKVASYTIDLPSNLSLPQQTESYFISIQLNKPEFRLNIDEDGVQELYALYGRFPLNDMVKGFQNDKSLFELVEFFDFLSAGVKTVPVKGDTSGVTIPVNQFNFTGEQTVKAPVLANDKVMLSFALSKDNDLFFPTDIKKVASGKTMALVQKETGEHWNLSLLMNAARTSFRDTFDGNLLSGAFGGFYSENRTTSPLTQVTYTFNKATQLISPQFLPMIAAPTFDKTKWIVRATAPTTIASVNAYATTLTLSEVSSGGSETFPIDFKKTLWSKEVMGWSKEFQIPQDVKNLIQSGKSYSWDGFSVLNGG